jgi:asparagine synthase (glutamine-hydrolysing)
LRKLAEKYLPPELINQPKRGFEIPLKKWIDNELKDMIAGYLFSSNDYVVILFQSSLLVICGIKKKAGDEKRAKMLWTLFALEVWHKKVYTKA